MCLAPLAPCSPLASMRHPVASCWPLLLWEGPPASLPPLSSAMPLAGVIFENCTALSNFLEICQWITNLSAKGRRMMGAHRSTPRAQCPPPFTASLPCSSSHQVAQAWPKPLCWPSTPRALHQLSSSLTEHAGFLLMYFHSPPRTAFETAVK